jgi:hypothetical protein
LLESVICLVAWLDTESLEFAGPESSTDGRGEAESEACDGDQVEEKGGHSKATKAGVTGI